MASPTRIKYTAAVLASAARSGCAAGSCGLVLGVLGAPSVSRVGYRRGGRCISGSKEMHCWSGYDPLVGFNNALVCQLVAHNTEGLVSVS